MMTAALVLSSAVVGVNVHSLDPALVPSYAKAGFRAVRFDLPWSSIEWHDGDHWEQVDTFVATLRAHRLAPVITIHGSLRPDGYAPVEKAERVGFAHFAMRAARRYKGAVWEIWNEPNVPGFWLPAPDAAAYVDLLAVTSIAIRAEDPTARIIGPSLGSGTLDWAYLGEFIRWGGLNYIDALAVHPYGVGAPENAADYYAGLTRATGGTLPIVVSEWGFSNQNEDMLGELVVRGLAVNEGAGIGLTIVYEWQDSPGGGANTPHMGLCRQDGTPKRALARVSDYLRRLSE
jgi:polysaccharide biosynthesis protein PslG